MWILRLKGLTVEFPTTLDPRLTATLVIPSPCYYGLFFFGRSAKQPYIFL